jgi:hypothetical protein
MKSIILPLVLILLFVVPITAQERLSEISSLQWLSGCWEMVEEGQQVSEMWMEPAGNTMLGTGRTVRNGETVSYEFMIIHTGDDGEIYFTAIPSGQSETSFLLIKLSDYEVIFENPNHDFPKLISYNLNDNGELSAHIEGTYNGETSFVNFRMVKVDCGGKTISE